MAYLAVIKTTVPAGVAVYSPSGTSIADFSACLDNGDILSSSNTQLDGGVDIRITLWKNKTAHDNFINAVASDMTARNAYNAANGITITKNEYVI